MKRKVDLKAAWNGSIVLVTASTTRARAWVKANVAVESWAWMGRDTFAVEPRMVGALLDGAAADGLVVA